MAAARAEVLVVGGGPAGCAAARLLSQWGHDVVLVTRPPSPAHALAESIPPSTGKLFDLLGIRGAIDRAGFIRSTGNTVWWGEDGARVEPFAGGALGWQVTADRLERVLQQSARDAGAHLEFGRLTIDDALARGAAQVLDCTGRSGIVARARGWRVFEPAHRTVALGGLWRTRATFELSDPTHTVIESYADGWAWSVPQSSAGSEAQRRGYERYVAVMVDPRSSDLAQDRTSRDVYVAEIQKTQFLARLVCDADLVSGPLGWDASMYAATRYADDRVLLVGDAGSFIDPLASIGVKKALASGWLAAVVTHTALTRPAMRTIALDFFSIREAEIYSAFRRLTAQYLTEAATAHAHPFWSDRTERDDGDANEDAVHAAFERIRGADAIRLQRASGLRVDERPAVAGSEIVMESRIVSGGEPAGVRYLFDVDLLALIDLAPAYAQVPDLFAAYNRRHAPVSLPDFLTALATAVARGYLETLEADS